jgi:hypothetical protein
MNGGSALSRTVFALAILSLGLLTPLAEAQPEAESVVAPTVERSEPVDPLEALLSRAPLEEVCDELTERLEGEARGDTSLLLARCRERQGRLATAWALFGRASAMLRAEDDVAAAAAASRAEALEPRVPKLLIEATKPPPGFVIVRDGTRYGLGVLGVAVAVDPGRHTLSARAPGHRAWSTTLEIVAGKTERVVVPSLERLAASTAPTEEPSDELLTAGVMLSGIGLGTIGIGAVLGVVAARDVHTAEADDALCGSDKRCTPEGYGLIERAEREAMASTVLVAAGTAAVVAGLATLVWRAHVAGAELRAAPGPGRGTIDVRVRF